MKKRGIIIILIILLLLLFIVYISNFENTKSELINNSYNNTTNIQLNNMDDENSSNITFNDADSNFMKNSNKIKKNDVKHQNKDNKKKEINTHNGKNNKKKEKNSYDDALMAKKMVDKYSLDENHIAGNPVFKYMDCWLVPIFDKNTGEFTGSIFAHPKGEGFFVGPSSYSMYKEIISGKKNKSDSDEQSSNDRTNSNASDNQQESIHFYPIGKSNQDIPIDSNDVMIDNQEDKSFEDSNILDCDSDEVILGSGGDVNSTG